MQTFKSGFPAQVFENHAVIASMQTTKMHIFENDDAMCMHILCSVYSVQAHSISLQSNIVNWPGMNNTAFLVIFTDP